MLRIHCFYVLLVYQIALHDATPLIGQGVKMANLGDFPFIVSISWNYPENLDVAEINHFCGGSLITHQHVLTAAHCVKNKQLDQTVVRIGSIDLRNAETYKIEWWSTYSNWSNVVVPPNYNADSIYDIAVIKLVETVSSDIELPILSYTKATLLYGRVAITAGWGRLANGKIPRYLRIGKFSVMRPEKCEVFISEKDPFLKYLEPQLSLCSTAAPPASTTCGDSGSPLLSKHNHLLAINKNLCFPQNDSSLSAVRNLHSFVNFYENFIETMKNK